MLLLLGEIASDRDGDRTLDVVSDLLEEYVETLADSGPEGVALAQATSSLLPSDPTGPSLQPVAATQFSSASGLVRWSVACYSCPHELNQNSH
jgi:hypothetical protein